MNNLISDLQRVSARLAKSPFDHNIALRLIGEAIGHLTSRSDGYATGIELDLIALTLRAQFQLTEAETVKRAANVLTQSAHRNRSANAQEGSQSNVVSFAARRSAPRRAN